MLTLSSGGAEPEYKGSVSGQRLICLSKFEHRFSDRPKG